MSRLARVAIAAVRRRARSPRRPRTPSCRACRRSPARRRCRRSPAASRARHPGRALRRQRRRRLPRHPAPGHQRPLQRGRAGRLPRHRRDRPALLRPARHVPRPAVRDAGADSRARSPTTSRTRRSACKPDDAERTYSPRADVTIVRDKALRRARTSTARRAPARCSALGYAAAEDRLFFMDVLRHAGRGELSSFAGGVATGDGRRAVGGRALHRGRPRSARSTSSPSSTARRARCIQRDVDNYVAGINQYIAEARLDPTKMPGEYAAIGQPQGPDPWKPTDLIATAVARRRRSSARAAATSSSWAELQAGASEALRRKRRARSVWRDFRAAEDPEAPTTVRKQALPVPDARRARAQGRARCRTPARCSAHVVDGGSRRARRRARRLGRRLGGAAVALPHGDVQRAARLGARVGDRPPAGGRSGPQVGYFSPQILMEEDVHAPARARHRRARRVVPGRQPLRPARPRPRLRLERDLGRPGHHRHLRGRPLRPGRRRRRRSTRRATCSAASACRSRCSSGRTRWSPTPADQTPPGSRRCAPSARSSGSSSRRATIERQAGAYTQLRSTYFHEVDSARGFADFNDPAKMRDAAELPAGGVEDRLHVQLVLRRRQAHRLLQLGRQPGARRRTSTTTCPVRGAAVRVARLRPGHADRARTRRFGQHPQVVDQDYLTSAGTTSRRPATAGADDERLLVRLPLAAARRTGVKRAHRAAGAR